MLNNWCYLGRKLTTSSQTLITLPIIAAIWYSNTWETAYLPINSNVRLVFLTFLPPKSAAQHVYDNTGSLYSVANAVGNNTLFDQALYDDYSPAYLAAGNILLYGIFCESRVHRWSHAVLLIFFDSASRGVYGDAQSRNIVPSPRDLARLQEHP